MKTNKSTGFYIGKRPKRIFFSDIQSMYYLTTGRRVTVEEVNINEVFVAYSNLKTKDSCADLRQDITSAIADEHMAYQFNVECNKAEIKLYEGDILYVGVPVHNILNNSGYTIKFQKITIH